MKLIYVDLSSVNESVCKVLEAYKSLLTELLI